MLNALMRDHRAAHTNCSVDVMCPGIFLSHLVAHPLSPQEQTLVPQPEQAAYPLPRPMAYSGSIVPPPWRCAERLLQPPHSLAAALAPHLQEFRAFEYAD